MFAFPTKPDDSLMSVTVRNILAVYDSATHEQIGRGKAWYPEANALARELDDNVTRAAGVIAALSANKGWRDNVNCARAAYAGARIGHTGNAVGKAIAILKGKPPEEVLPMDIKTGNFYRCIAHPMHPNAVCVDRHAHDIAHGEPLGQANRGLGNPRRYAWLSEAYRASAARLGVLPSAAQAVTWIVWRQRLGSGQGRTHNAANGW